MPGSGLSAQGSGLSLRGALSNAVLPWGHAQDAQSSMMPKPFWRLLQQSFWSMLSFLHAWIV